MRNILTGILISFCLSGTAQYDHGLGYFRAGINMPFSSFGDGSLYYMPSLNVTPGLRIIRGADFTTVLTLPISVGKATNDFWLDYSQYGIDLPMMLEFNFGASTGSGTSGNGITVGAGAGYQYMGFYEYYDQYNRIRTHDLDFWSWRLCFGYSFGKEASGDRYMFLANYGKSFTNAGKYTYSLGFYFIVGNRK